MSEEEIRIEIAKLCGWADFGMGVVFGRLVLCGNHTEKGWSQIPNYTQSLDACATFEVGLKDLERSKYCTNLVGVCNQTLEEGTVDEEAHEAIFATPLQRCEAFLRLHGKWAAS